MNKQYYQHLGYFHTLNDVLNLCDKTAEYIVEEYLKGNGNFCDVSDSELDEVALTCYYPTYINVRGKEYAVTKDIDWVAEELFKLDVNSDKDNEWYDTNPAYIDIYVLKEE